MSLLVLALACMFLPLFPFSMLVVWLLGRLSQSWQRAVLVLFWPQIGVWLVLFATPVLPDWLAAWALATALLYALRALTLRELGRWIAFLAISSWSLLWLPLLQGEGQASPALMALAFSAPLMLLLLLRRELERRFGAAFAGLPGGLAESLPRLSGVLVVTILAVVATPFSPSFFALLGVLLTAPLGLMVAVLALWLLWSWGAVRLLQRLVAGPAGGDEVPDLNCTLTWGYTAVLILMLGGGMILAENLL